MADVDAEMDYSNDIGTANGEGSPNLTNGSSHLHNGTDEGIKIEDVEKKESSHHKSHKSSHHKSSHHGDHHKHHKSHKSSHKSSHGDKHHHSSSTHKSSSRDKDKDHKSSSRDKDKDHKSSSHDKEHKSSSHKSSSRDKEHKSSSSSHHKSSSRDKDHKSSSSHRHSSSSSSHKHKSSHRHSSSSRHKSSHSEKAIKEEAGQGDGVSPDIKTDVKVADIKVKTEIPSPVKKPVPNYAESDDDMPLSSRKVKKESDSEPEYDFDQPQYKREAYDDDEDDKPLSSRRRSSGGKSSSRNYDDDSDDEPLESRKRKKRKASDDDEFSAKKKKKSSGEVKILPALKSPAKRPAPKEEESASPKKGKKAKKDENEPDKWRWWEEERIDDGTKWTFLEHKGPMFAPVYEPLPTNVHFYYDGERVNLSEPAEEVATFYGRMLDHDYTTKDIFNTNFMRDWRKTMTEKEKLLIRDLKKCNFNEILAYYKDVSEKRKAMTKEEKKVIKDENARLVEEMGFCMMDGHKEKIANFRIEPPGLFRGRGDHPKQGMHKKRVMPEDVVINCSKDAKVPPAPEGHKWKEVRHDPTVSWLACWVENVQQQHKYVMLNAGSKLKGEKDWMKYEVARKLHPIIGRIRSDYINDFKAKEMRIRQRAVALYFIDKLALRAGNEKDEDQADTVGCCSLRVEHITLHPEKDGLEWVVEFDFLGKDSIRYNNSVPVEKRVFKNLERFMENKKPNDDLFDRLNTAILNKHLTTLMDGLTAKVFRTYNASKTLEEQLEELTDPNDNEAQKLLSYNRANRKVAILCNHQRAVPKTFDKSMENLRNKIDEKRKVVKQAKKDWKEVKKSGSAGAEKKKATYDRLSLQLKKLEIQLTDKDEGKEIALGTSKLNYLDPRISVAWAKKWEVKVEKVYNKTQRDKFAWAVDMADEDFCFRDWNSDH